MVQELKTTQNNNSTQTIDLSALGDVANAKLMEGAEKPKLLDPVEATIKTAEVKMTDRLNTNRNDDSKVFYQGYLTVETEFVNPETESLVTSKDSFGGLRFYVSVDGTGEVIKKPDGSAQISRLWIGDTSQLGKLLKLVQKYDKNITTYQDFFSFFTPGRKVKIKTLFTSYKGEQKYKQIITEIL